MANTTAIKAGKAYVELSLQNNLTKGLRAAQQRLQAWGAGIRGIGTKLAGVGVVAAAGLGAAVRSFAGFGDSLSKMSQRTGVSVESLSELAYAASQSGTDIATLETGIRVMQRTINDAGRGLSTAIDGFEALGLTVEHFRGLKPEDQLKLVADRLSRVEDPSKRAALAMQLLGRSGTRLLPLFAEGAAGIEALQQKARDLGLTIGNDDAQAAVVFGDTLDDLIKVIKRGVFAMGAALAPALTQLIERIIRVAVTVVEWIKTNRQLVLTVGKVVVGIVAAGGALVGVGLAVSALGGVFGAMATVITGVGAAFGVLGSVIAALVSPIGLVITAVGALGAYLLYSTDLGGKALAWLGDRFGALKDTALAAYQGIADALATGDIALAAKILWLTLKMEWQRGINALHGYWLSFKEMFLNVAYGAFYGALAAFEMVWHGLEVAFIETTAFLTKVWANFTAGFQKAWGGAVNWTAKRLLELQGMFDSSFDADTAKQLADQNRAADDRRIDRERDAMLQQTEDQRRSRREQARQTHENTLGAIGQEYEDAKAQLTDAYDQQRTESERALADARREWEDAVAEAARKRADATAPDAPGRIKSPADFMSELDDLADVAKRTVEVRGTFNAAMLMSLQASPTEDRIARASEETAKNTRKIERNQRDSEMVFD